MPGRAFVGTSGWSYTSWRPKFYPEGTKSAQLLRYYATRLSTIEINYTFNHLPTEKNVAEWTGATPEHFAFGLKASQQITHRKQLREPAETLPIFFERARLLGPRLGPILFQTRRGRATMTGSRCSSRRCRRVCERSMCGTRRVRTGGYDLLRTANVPLVQAEGEKRVTGRERSASRRLRVRAPFGRDATRTSGRALAARLRVVLAEERTVPTSATIRMGP